MSALSQRVLKILERPPRYSSLKALWKRENLTPKFQEFIESQPITKEYQLIKAHRSQLDKYAPPKLQYFNFLKILYPVDQKHINFPELYQAYLQLPQPRPLFIDAQHLERLLSSFREHGGERRSILTNLIENVHADLKRSEIPISIIEKNNEIYIKYYNQKNIEYIIGGYNTMMQSDTREKLDISTMNIFLKFAVKHGHTSLMRTILSDCNELDLKYNRITYTTLLTHFKNTRDIDGANELFKRIQEEAQVLDIYYMNIFIDIMVNCGEVEQAHIILSKICEAPRVSSSNSSNIDGNLKRRNYKDISRFLDSTGLQPLGSLLFNLEPAYETFSPLLNHYTTLQHFNPEQILHLLNETERYNIQVPITFLQKLISVFEHHEIEDHEQYLPKILKFLQRQRSKHHNRQDSLFHSLIGSLQKQSRFQLKNPNLLDLKWTKLQVETKSKNWKLVDMNRMNEDVIKHMIDEY